MATPSAKHATFTSKSIKGVGVEDVPGIGDKSKERLSKEEITKAQQLLGHFLIRNMDKEKCKNFLQKFGMNEKQQTDAFNALNEWAEQHL
ncbi:barrier-to-autointegration factor B-like [Mytilus californianus]|uniref:barrier-to-autointegration factor B-like n=1 Tax=Mytilus californianus TaxID=6549 RepID=UPI00224588E4|nr:barrier-to-autointegration factor B-like [Mytilus californianus]